MAEEKHTKVMNAVGEYFKLRDLPDKISNKVDISLEEGISAEEKAAVQSLVWPSTPNSFLYSTITSQFNFLEQQYIKLKAWMTEASEPCRSELSQILFPVFIHFFVELLTSGAKSAAKAFFQRHHQVFRVNKDYENTLRYVCSTPDFNCSSVVLDHIKSGKYTISLSELTLHYFFRFLQTSSTPTVVYVFNNYMEIETSEFGGSVLSYMTTGDTSSHNENIKRCDKGGTPSIPTELPMVNEVINNVRAMMPTMPSLLVYNVFSSRIGLSCSQIDDDAQLLAGGFENSVIKLWKLKDNKMQLFGRQKPQNEPLCIEKIFFDDIITDDLTLPEDELRSGRNGGSDDVYELRGHQGPVYDLAFSDDCTHMFSVGEDTTMRLWDIEKRCAVVIYEGHNYPIWSVCTSPKTLYVATGSYDTTARIWATECTYPVRTLVGHTASVDCVTFHPNCSYVATGSSDRSIRLWQLTDGSVARILLHHATTVTSLSFSSDGKYLASGCDNGELVVWDLAAGKVLCRLAATNQSDSIVSLCWTMDSSQLISSSLNGVVRSSYVDVASSPELQELKIVSCLSPNSNGESLIHTSLNRRNYLSAVVSVPSER